MRFVRFFYFTLVLFQMLPCMCYYKDVRNDLLHEADQLTIQERKQLSDRLENCVISVLIYGKPHKQIACSFSDGEIINYKKYGCHKESPTNIPYTLFENKKRQRYCICQNTRSRYHLFYKYLLFTNKEVSLNTPYEILHNEIIDEKQSLKNCVCQYEDLRDDLLDTHHTLPQHQRKFLANRFGICISHTLLYGLPCRLYE